VRAATFTTLSTTVTTVELPVSQVLEASRKRPYLLLSPGTRSHPRQFGHG